VEALRTPGACAAEKEAESFKFDPAILAARRSVRIANQNKFGRTLAGFRG